MFLLPLAGNPRTHSLSMLAKRGVTGSDHTGVFFPGTNAVNRAGNRAGPRVRVSPEPIHISKLTGCEFVRTLKMDTNRGEFSRANLTGALRNRLSRGQVNGRAGTVKPTAPIRSERLLGQLQGIWQS